MILPNKSATSRVKLLAGMLCISVVLNLFLGGVLAGGAGSRHKHFGPMALAASHGEYMSQWIGRFLEPTDAAAFGDAVQAQSTALKQAHDHVRQATKDVASVFEQDPPDAVSLQTALDRLGEAKDEVNASVKRIVQDAYLRLSPDGRRRLAELTR
jgi:uncharacterized membrane protein